MKLSHRVKRHAGGVGEVKNKAHSLCGRAIILYVRKGNNSVVRLFRWSLFVPLFLEFVCFPRLSTVGSRSGMRVDVDLLVTSAKNDDNNNNYLFFFKKV